MIRTALLSVVLAVATIAPLAVAPPAAAAQPPWYPRYELLVRYGPGPWQYYDSYYTRLEADSAANTLKCRGFDVVVNCQ